MKPYKSYVICTSPRSGSTMLCKMLSETGIAGHPESYFHTPSIPEWLSSFDLGEDNFDTEQSALKAIFEGAQNQGTGTTGVFGLRLQGQSLPFFLKQLKKLHPEQSNDRQLIDTVFGETLFTHLTRTNKLDQAVSLVKALQSGLWHLASDGTEIERTAQPKPLVYDDVSISRELKSMNALEDAWIIWFEQQKLDPLQVTYADLSQRPKATLARILKALGQPIVNVQDITIGVAKLADQTNQEWVDRFRAEHSSKHR
ncbi:MAG: Stf0 family sulfotransferase [Paracoccaceae bacterium]